MPFLWNVVAKQGQIFGNQAKGSKAQATNRMHFSYPGYSETLCGFVDPRIDSNEKHLDLGKRENTSPVTQSEVAATLAALLGEDFCAAVPQAAMPIAEVLPRSE